MKQLDTVRLRKNLRTVVDDVEQALHHMSDTTGERVGELSSRAGRQVHEVHDRLGDLEHRTADQARRAGRRTQTYVRQHPWQLLAGLAAAAVALSLLARTRL